MEHQMDEIIQEVADLLRKCVKKLCIFLDFLCGTFSNKICTSTLSMFFVV